MTPKAEINIRNEFYIPKSVILEVLHLKMLLETKRMNFPIRPTGPYSNMADGAILNFAIARFVP